MKIKHLPTATPINGSASLRVTESVTIPVYRDTDAIDTITKGHWALMEIQCLLR